MSAAMTMEVPAKTEQYPRSTSIKSVATSTADRKNGVNPALCMREPVKVRLHTSIGNLCSERLARKMHRNTRTTLPGRIAIDLRLNERIITGHCRVVRESMKHDVVLGGSFLSVEDTQGQEDTTYSSPRQLAFRISPSMPKSERLSAVARKFFSVSMSLHLTNTANTGDHEPGQTKICSMRKKSAAPNPAVSGFRSHSATPGSSKRRETSTTPKSPRLPKASKTGDGDDSDKKKSSAAKKRKKVVSDDEDDEPDDNPGDPDSDPDDGPPVTGRGKRRTVPEAESEDGHDAEGTFAEYVSSLLQTQDVGLRNAQRIAQNLRNATLRHDYKLKLNVATEAANEEGIPMDTYLRGPQIPGRNVQPGSVEWQGKMWKFSLIDMGKGSNKVFKAKNPSCTLSGGTLPKNTARRALNQICAELARYFNTWPWTEVANGVKPIAEFWFARILTTVQNRLPELHDVELQKEDYLAKIHWFDSAKGAMVTKYCRIRPTDLNMKSVTVPPLPPMILRATSPWKETKSITEYIGKTSVKAADSSTASQHKAQDALRWINYQLDGLVTTEERLDTLIDFYKGQLGFHKGFKSGSLSNKGNLFKLSRSSYNRRMQVRPSAAFLHGLDLQGETTKLQLTLYINSLNASRTTPVTETVIQLFTSGQDLRVVWIEAAKIADEVNLAITEGMPPSSLCDCNETEAGTELHSCEGCSKPVVCFTRRNDSRQRLVCNLCFVRDKAHYTFPLHPDETLREYLLRTGLTGSFGRECFIRGDDPDSSALQKIIRAAVADVKAQLDDDPKTFIDLYTGNLHQVRNEEDVIGNNPSRRRYNPSNICVDAAFPEGLPNARGLKHSAGNLVITTNALNMAKWIHLPGILQVISDYLRLTAPSGQDQDTLQESLIKLTVARLKHRFVRALSQESNDTPEQTKLRLDKSMAEMIRGEVSPNEPGPWDTRSKRYVSSEPPRFTGKNNLWWGNAAYDRLQKCIQSISQRFGVEDSLFMLNDGTLWFGNENTHPEDFDRNSVFQLCRECLARMRLKCNNKWVTDENEETLYMEIMFQYCASITSKASLQSFRKKYGDRLRLPLNVFINSPLKISVAHRVHGYGMSTGWGSHRPANVEERLRNDAENNMLIESCIIRSVSVGDTRFNRTIPAPATSGYRSFDCLSDDFLREDEFEGERFDNDAFENEPDATGADIDASGVTAAAEGTQGGEELEGGEELHWDEGYWFGPPPPEFDEGAIAEEERVFGDQVRPSGAPIEHDPADVTVDDMTGSLRGLRRAIIEDRAAATTFIDALRITSFLSEAESHAQDGDYRRFLRAIREAENLLQHALYVDEIMPRRVYGPHEEEGED